MTLGYIIKCIEVRGGGAQVYSYTHISHIGI